MKPELKLYDYWRIIRKRKWMVLVISGLTVLSTVIWTERQPEMYRSYAMLKFQPPASYLKTPGADLTDFENVHTEVKILSSEEITEKAAENLGMFVEGMDFREKNRIVKEVKSTYKVEKVENSSLINIYADSPEPMRSCKIINAVIEAYKTTDFDRRSSQIQKMLEDMKLKKSEAEENLYSLERAKQNFLERHNKEGLGSILANQLIDLEIRKKELQEKYTPNHPEIIGTEQKINVIQSKLSELPALEMELVRISREFRMKEDLYMTLNKKYEEIKLGLASLMSFITIVSPPSQVDKPVSPNRWVNYSISVILAAVLSLFAVFFLEQFNITITTIEELEEFIKLPVLGMVPMFGSTQVDNWLAAALGGGRHSVEHLKNFLVSSQKESDVIEFYNTIRTSIAAQNFKSRLISSRYEELQVKTPVKVNLKQDMSVIITSSNMGEGKTLTAVNFALACANSGQKTLLVDADLRKPIIHRIFGLNIQPGLSEVLSDKILWESAIKDKTDFAMSTLHLKQAEQFAGIDNLKIITSGVPAENIVDLLSSSSVEELIEDLKYEFNVIILDAPPILTYADTTLLANYLDGVVLVYKFGKTPQGALQRARDQLTDINARVIGIVLNGVKTSEMTSQYGYYYYYSYGHRKG